MQMSMSGEDLSRGGWLRDRMKRHVPNGLTKKGSEKREKETKRKEKLRLAMEKIFKESCYENDGGWIKPREFNEIMEDVIDKTIKYLETER